MSRQKYIYYTRVCSVINLSHLVPVYLYTHCNNTIVNVNIETHVPFIFPVLPTKEVIRVCEQIEMYNTYINKTIAILLL